MTFPATRFVRCSLATAAILLTFTPAARSDVVTLYDPSLGSLPASQGWISVVLPPATQAVTGGLLQLNTTADRDTKAGYFSENPLTGSAEHPLMPVLNRLHGYTISFDLKVLAEGHNARDDNGDARYDRSGFSVIAISQDLLGLELGFFEDRIWAYAADGEGANSLFTQAEGIAFDTTDALTQFDLAVQGNSYRLSAGGSEILTGSLRNYSSSGLSPFYPYDNPSSLFFGDDTGSADSSVLLGSIHVSAAPEPSTFALMLLASGGLAAVSLRRRFRRKSPTL